MFSKINQILNNDGVIAFVTDTVWGIGCLPTSQKAVQRIYEIKKREAKKPLILMSDDIYPLFDYVKHQTALYKSPRIIEFVNELPKTASGKIRRVEIREKDKGKEKEKIKQDF